MRTPTTTLVPLLLAGTLLTGCTGSGGDIDVLSEGSGETVDLSAAYETGQSWQQQMRADMSLDLAVQSVDYGFTMDVTTSVEDVEPNVKIAQSVEAVDITSAPEGTEEQLQSELDTMVGATITSYYDEAGIQQGDATWSGGTPPEGQTSFGTMPAFPTDPVGEGASWTVNAELSPGQGIDDIDVETTYELVSLDGDQYTLDMTQSGEIEGEQQDVEIEGSFTGSGTMTGTVGDPMPETMEFTQEIEASAQGQTMSMTNTVTYTSR